jgi:hypothetical protein
VALEELSSGIWALIAAGIAAVIYAIVRFFKWIRGDKEQSSEAAVKDRVSQLSEVQALLRKCDKLIAEGVSSTHGQYMYLREKPREEVYTLDKVIATLFTNTPHEKRIAAFLKSKDPFFHDLVHQGPYSTELAQLGHLFKDLQVILRQRLGALETVSKLDLYDESPTARMANMKALDLLENPAQVKYHDRDMTLQEIRSQIYHLSHETSTMQVEGDISFDRLFSTMTAAFERSDVKSSLEELTTTLPLLDQLKDQLQKLEAQAGSYAKDGQEGGHSTRIGSQLRRAVFVLGQDVAALSTITAELMSYQNRLFYLASNAASFATAVASRLAHEGLNQNGGELSTWYRVGNDLKKVDREFQRLVKR